MIVTGHSIHISVRRGCLVIKTADREERIEKLPKLHDRLILTGNIGLVTLEAMAWMHDYGLAWRVMSRDRGSIASNDDGRGDPEVWKAQAMADPLPVTRFLLAAKLNGQADNAELMGSPDTAKRMRRHVDELLLDTRIPLMTGREGHVARVYWNLWYLRVTVPWIADHMLKVPPRWLGFKDRRSLIMSESNRNATDPVNAMLNYVYKVGETLCVEACREVGLSPVLGMTHNRKHWGIRDGDTPRQSMALDLLEAIRPLCDRVILEMLDYGQGIKPYLRWTDFLELGTGVVRVESAKLRERIIRDCEGYRAEVAGYASEVVKLICQK